MKASTEVIEGKTAYVIPLTGRPVAQLATRYTRAQAAETSLLQSPDVSSSLLQDWWITGPFALGAFPFDFSKRFAPEQEYSKGNLNLQATYLGAGDKTVSWQHINAGKPTGAGLVNFNDYFQPNENVAAYAFTKIVSDRDRTVTLLTGSDDTISVWVNGKSVLAKDVYRGAALDSDRTSINLKKGENTVLVRVFQGGGGWGFYFRLADEFGLPVTNGLSYGVAG